MSGPLQKDSFNSCLREITALVVCNSCEAPIVLATECWPSMVGLVREYDVVQVSVAVHNGY